MWVRSAAGAARAALAVLAGPALFAVVSVAPVEAAAISCPGPHWVASWAASPTDALVPADPGGASVPVVATHQTLRLVIAPHLGGTTVRIRLSNRFGSSPVTFGRVTIGRQVRGASVSAPVPLLFAGRPGVTAAAGSDVVSDPAPLSFAAFDHLAVSIFVPGVLVPVTKHWNANATAYLTPALSGDHSAETGSSAFTSTAQSWLYVDGLDTLAPATTRSVVAFGDSITDGFVAGSPFSVPADMSVADTDSRYPDFLQHRLISAGVPISVVNAGIGSNMLLTSGAPLMLGPAGIDRFSADALAQSGVAGVLLLEGINDLGLVQSSAAQLIGGYQNVIGQAHAAGVRIWVGTILPASNALVDGTATAPNSETDRQAINTWIRGQTLADGVVDFDRALRDPSDPSILRPAYASVDNLHPSPAGYRRMAEVVDLGRLGSVTGRC